MQKVYKNPETNKLQLLDGTELKKTEVTHHNNIRQDGNKFRINGNYRGGNYWERDGDEWSDYAYTADDF